MTHHLYVATNGLSVWSSSDLGETISRMPSSTGMYSGSQVWALAVHPSEPGVLLAGTDSGVYRLNQATQGNGRTCRRQWTTVLVTALAFSPEDPSDHGRRWYTAFGGIPIRRCRRNLDRH